VEEPIAEARPWERLAEAAAENDADRVTELLDELSVGEKARTLSRLDEETRSHVISLIGPEEAARLMEAFDDTQAAEILSELEPRDAAVIVSELPSDEQADVLADLEEEEAAAILAELAPAEAAEARELLEYDPLSAGGLMVREFLSFPEDTTVSEVLEDLRTNRERYSDFDVQYAYIVARDGSLVGVLRMRDLLLGSPQEPVRNIMLPDPIHVRGDTPLEELLAFFHDHRFVGVPVVDARERLAGIVHRTDVEEHEAERAHDDFLKVSGLSGREEFRSMPVRQRSVRRLSWLSINIVLNLISASVIALYTDTLEAAIALAVFLPIISDMSGCSGNQAVAVSIRELTLGLVRPFEFVRVFLKEASVGLINGSLLGILLGLLAFVWKGNPWLGGVVAAAMMLNTLVAVIIGGLVPLLLRRLGFDAALASGPILTTVTDLCGFFLVLSFATAVLSKLAV